MSITLNDLLGRFPKYQPMVGVWVLGANHLRGVE
jgi:hypothetical protein